MFIGKQLDPITTKLDHFELCTFKEMGVAQGLSLAPKKESYNSLGKKGSKKILTWYSMVEKGGLEISKNVMTHTLVHTPNMAILDTKNLSTN